MNRYKQGLSEELPDIKKNTLQTNLHVQQLTGTDEVILAQENSHCCCKSATKKASKYSRQKRNVKGLPIKGSPMRFLLRWFSGERMYSACSV